MKKKNSYPLSLQDVWGENSRGDGPNTLGRWTSPKIIKGNLSPTPRYALGCNRLKHLRNESVRNVAVGTTGTPGKNNMEKIYNILFSLSTIKTPTVFLYICIYINLYLLDTRIEWNKYICLDFKSDFMNASFIG